MPYIKRHQRKIYVNIVPLVDVLIVLLFFFIATMQFKQFKVLNIKIPEIKTAGVNQIDEQISIAIDASGDYLQWNFSFESTTERSLNRYK